MPEVRIVTGIGSYGYKGRLFESKTNTGQPKDHTVTPELLADLLTLEGSPFREVVNGIVIDSPSDTKRKSKAQRERTSRTFLTEEAKATLSETSGDMTIADVTFTDAGNEEASEDDVDEVAVDDVEVAKTEYLETADDADDLPTGDEDEEEAKDEGEAGTDGDAPSDADGDGHDDKTGKFVEGNTVAAAKATKENAPAPREGPRLGKLGKKRAAERKVTIVGKNTEGGVEA